MEKGEGVVVGIGVDGAEEGVECVCGWGREGGNAQLFGIRK